ncbi:MAG: polymer-forming cytoskeletal protein [Anaerolineales bacterium]|jgi:cytoskeletal protein CcmA (bactofilin family)
MFRRTDDRPAQQASQPERVDSVLGSGLTLQGQLSGTGGVRIDGAFDGEIALRGIVVIGEGGRVTCEKLRANTLIISGSLKGDVIAHRVEITSSGRVWGDVTTSAFSTQEGAFLRGKITMEEQIDLGLGPELETSEQDEGEEEGS